MYFSYGEAETGYLKNRDQKLGEVIDTVGHINRTVDPDLFSSVVHHIIGQQISTKAQHTIWNRLNDSLGKVDAETILSCDPKQLQSFGLSFRKVDYIRDFAEKVQCGSFDPERIRSMSDPDAVKELTAIRGVGVWTAEMILLFCLERPDVFSCDDLALQRGLRMLYHHRSVSRELFEKYRRRYSPYGSVASLYLWAVAGGAVEGMKDFAPTKK